MRRIAERLAGASAAETGLAGVAPLALPVPQGRPRGVPRPEERRVGDGRARRRRRVPPGPAAHALSRRAVRTRLPCPTSSAGTRSTARPGTRRPAIPSSCPSGPGGGSLGYGSLPDRRGPAAFPGTLRLLDAVGAQVAAFCECVSRGDRAKPGSGSAWSSLVRSNQDLGWLLRVQRIASLAFRPGLRCSNGWAGSWGTFVPIVGLELVSMSGGPVSASAPTSRRRCRRARTASPSRGNGRGILPPGTGSTFRESDFRLKRFPCLPVEGNWDLQPEARRTSGRSRRRCITPGRVLGVLAVYRSRRFDGRPPDRRADRFRRGAGRAVPPQACRPGEDPVSSPTMTR